MSDKTEQEDFRNYCKLFNALGTLGFPTFVVKDGPIPKFKVMFYLLYLMFLPISLPIAQLFIA